MRRMLDPTEVGGDGKQYCHFVEVDPKDGGEIYFNYTSTDATKLTKETILSALTGKFLICNGYVKVNDVAKTPEYIYVSVNQLATKWIDLTNLGSGTKTIDIDYLDDKVYPVAA